MCSINMFVCHLVATGDIANLLHKLKKDGHNWGLAFNQYVPFSFHGNQTRGIANKNFSIKLQGESYDQGQK